MDSKNFTDLEIDAIGEILNISLGASATAVSTMLNARVDITTPVVQVLTKDEFEFTKLEPAVGVEITYVSGLSGSNIMLLKRYDVKVIVEMLMGMEIPDEEFELNELNISAICEVMNQMMGASSTALSEFLSRSVNISTPVSYEIEDEQKFKEEHFGSSDPMIVVGFTLRIADKLESEFINVMTIDLAKELVTGFFPDDAIEETPSQPEPAAEAYQPEPEEMGGGSDRMMSQEDIERLLASASGGAEESTPAPDILQPEEEEAGGGSDRMMSQEDIERLLASASGGAPESAPVQPEPQEIPIPATAVPPMMPPTMPAAGGAGNDALVTQLMAQMAQMQQQMLTMMGQQMQQQPKEPVEPKTIPTQKAPNKQLSPGGNSSAEQEENRELIMGVPLELSVEIGRTRKLVREILEFTKGSLIILDKLAGEQVDLFVNGRCIAKGDVVVVDDNFGIRITEIVRNNPPEVNA